MILELFQSRTAGKAWRLSLRWQLVLFFTGAALLITVASGLAITATDFETENNYDVLTINGVKYSGARGPTLVEPTGPIEWASDGSVSRKGWKLCTAEAPEQGEEQSDAPAGPITSTGGCPITDDGQCVTTPNFPRNYGDSETCSITVAQGKTVSATDFETERHWDKLTINGVVYSGTDGPQSVQPTRAITWSSDRSHNEGGWKLCVD